MIDFRDYSPVLGTDNSGAWQRAVTDACRQHKTLFIPEGKWQVNEPATARGFFAIEGANMWVSRLYMPDDKPILIVDLNDHCFYPSIVNLGFQGSGKGTLNNAGILFTGENESYLNHGNFQNLLFKDIFSGIRVVKSTNPDNHEMMFNWNRFTNLHADGKTHHLFRSEYGSGTGNLFSDLVCVTTSYSLMWLGKNSSNIGDIVITGAQFGSSEGISAAMYFGDGASYKNNILISNMQFDAWKHGFNFQRGYRHLKITNIIWGGKSLYYFAEWPKSSTVDLPHGLFRFDANGQQRCIIDYNA